MTFGEMAGNPAGVILISFLGIETARLVSSSEGNSPLMKILLKTKDLTFAGSALDCLDVIPSNSGAKYSGYLIACDCSHFTVCHTY